MHRDPGLVPTAVEELLRMVPSVTITMASAPFTHS